MSIYDARRIIKPRHFGLRPLSRGRGRRESYIIGFDSESENSRPFTLQFSLPDESEYDTHIEYVPRQKHAALHVFMRAVHNVCSSRKYEYLIYGFNLTYEFTQLFHDFTDDAKNASDFDFDYVMPDGSRYRWTVYNSKRHYATIRNLKTHVRIRFLDAHAFFSTSLAKAAVMLGVGEKLDKPPEFRRRDWQTQTFQEYAKRDAYITRLLGEKIIDMHREYDVATCISAPHFASSVYRRRFLNEEIPLPIEHLEQYGLWSYHGGKNGYYRDGPADILDVYSYDIRSAYPEAMRAIPDPVTATWELQTSYAPGTHSIWRALIEYDPCVFRGVQNVAGTYIGYAGRFVVYTTGYELDAMIAHGECRIVRAVGYVMQGESGGSLAEYVDTFYAMKSTTRDETERVTAKLFLNSLYGKFFQKVGIGAVGTYLWESGDYIASNVEQTYDYTAGGLYHPPLASLITGFVRAKIHHLEHKYTALMTSTDGIFATRAPIKGDLGTSLGMLDKSRGRLRIWRERLYIFDAGDHGIEDCDAPGCRDHKCALHGFRGKAYELAAIPLTTGRYGYSAQQVVTLGMSTRRFDGNRHDPGSFVTLPFALDV